MSNRVFTTQDLAGLDETPVAGEVWLQLAKRVSETGKGAGAPYWVLDFVDALGAARLRVFDSHPAFREAGVMLAGACVVLTGTWSRNKFGVESKDWRGRAMTEEEKAQFLGGPPELQAKQAKDFAAIESLVGSMNMRSGYRMLIVQFLADKGAEFRRAAAARGNHHARRGGLVEHVSYMMQAADALAALYAGLFEDFDRDLLLAGVFFHDVGKLWENQYPESGFEQAYQFDAECMGHIAIGANLVANLWGKLPEGLRGDMVSLRLLQHLILSHHGTLEWGSPVVPKRPEAVILHFVDNCDAKLEMMRNAYKTSKELAVGVIERVRPLEGHLLQRPTSNIQHPTSKDTHASVGGA